MLPVELVPTRRQGEELRLLRFDDEARARAFEIAKELVFVVEAQLGGPRGEIEEALAAIDVEARDVRLRAGLTKLLLDRCTFEAEPTMPPTEVREAVFLHAAAERRATGRVDRARIVEEASKSLGIEPSATESLLFADLRDAQPLQAFDAIGPGGLVSLYADALPQSVLLRATRIDVKLAEASPAALRALFRKLRFLRLLFTLAEDGDGYRLVLDGPMSLFDAQARYGLKLALALPALEACGHYVLEAEVRWGKERRKLRWKHEGGSSGGVNGDAPLPDEVEALRRAIAEKGAPWSVRRATAILNLPGIGVVVPDLELRHAAADGRAAQKVYVEVLGFWSRDAVWKRVELATRGLPEKVIFAVSSRLRVSEDVLPDETSSALYVYKGSMSVRGVLERAASICIGSSSGVRSTRS